MKMKRPRPTRPAATLLALLLAYLTLLLLILAGLFPTAHCREIVATEEWQLLSENDTIPAGLHVRMDLNTGEKWVKLPSDEDDDEPIRAAASDGRKVGSAEVDGTGALSVVETAEGGDERRDDETDEDGAPPSAKDYDMMHRVLKNLPPDELERFGGLPALPSAPTAASTDPAAVITAEQRAEFERRMEELWRMRQEELAELQEELADLPSMLKERRKVLHAYLTDMHGSLEKILSKRELMLDEEAREDEVILADDAVTALRDLEYQLADVDMARDFHTLNGWGYLVAILRENPFSYPSTELEDEEEFAVLVDEIRALAAMAIGTAVGNVGEFRHWALENVSPVIERSGPPPTAVSELVRTFETELGRRSAFTAEGGTMATPTFSAARYKSAITFRLRAVYALGALLRGNPAAQRSFVAGGGPDLLVRDALGTLSSARGPRSDKSLARLDYKLASKVLSLGEDVATDAALHAEDYEGDAGPSPGLIVGSFTTEAWCDLALRMLSPPDDGTIGEVAGRGIKERALRSASALGPGCMVSSGDGSWGVEEVTRVRSEWNREGSGDGLDPAYRRELLELADGVLQVLRK